MQTESALIKNTHKLILASLIIIILVVGKSFLIPLAWSILIGLASYRFVEKMKEKTILPAGLIILFFMLFIVSVISLFAVFLAILNLIPFVGNPIGMLVVALFTLVTKDSLLSLFLVIVALWLVNVVHENVLRPWLLGDKLKINAFVVFLSVIIGGLIWGVSGMILFIPITGIIKIILSQSETNAHYAILFSEKQKKKLIKKK
jgi:predicted PurR-regulated permease PerM